jgi:Lrp/AsnC family transcriptional regulator, leucine-responsive regulatory protein
MSKHSGQISPVTLDGKDLEILRILQRDAKLTVREIGDRINLSATPTHERIKRLEREGVIRQYVALLNTKMVRKNIMVICMVSLQNHDKKTAKQFIQSIRSFPEVIECYNISGDTDFLIKVVSESMESFHQFYVNKLSEIKGIGQTKSSFVMDVIKETEEII